MRLTKLPGILLLLCSLAPFAHAHVGSKDVYEQVEAGPYKLYVTIRPPLVIPGIANVEVRTQGGADVTSLKITPLPLVGEGARHPPTGDELIRSTTDPNFYTGAVWIMAPGSWQVRFEVKGAAGSQTISIPVLAVPVTTLKMERGLGFLLAALGLFLLVSMAGVVAGATRESKLRPGVSPTPAQQRRGWVTMAISLVVMVTIVWLGGMWWGSEAAVYAGNIYARPITAAILTGDQLDLTVKRFKGTSDGRSRSNDDFLPDHGHLIHLYAIREPEMDAAFHLHPERAAAGDFRMNLPSMPPGHYQLYGDVVHRNGFPETLTATVDIPAGLSGTPLASEDAEAMPTPLSQGPLTNSYKLPDGYTMVWDKPEALTASTGYVFHFHLVDPTGKPANEMQPYLGMAGHAAFVKTDGTVFAHTHPEGSASMQALMLANGDSSSMPGRDMPVAVGPSVDFPYGFPVPGAYRIFIQMKHAGIVETGVFDARVD